MDGPAIECSDSDSGESWTLLENSIHTSDIQDLSELPGERSTLDNHEKDDDTDGISIISDSEPDSPSPCQLNYEVSNDENHQSDPETAQFVTIESPLNNIESDHEDIKEEDDLLGSNIRKNKTYVHRRNKRLSTVLNIVVLASIITAAGVAIGHMWGAKSDCTLNNTPGVNKILSRLYRLQEENAYLRSKLKEITALNSNQANKAPIKQNKCRKMFEESLQNDENKKQVATCVDGRVDVDDRLLKSHMIQPPYEKDFVQDVRKLRNVYVQNRSWINEKAIKKIIQEKDEIKNEKTVRTMYVENEPKQKYEFDNNKMLDTENNLDNSDSLKFSDKIKKNVKRNADGKIKLDIENYRELLHDEINYLNQNKEFNKDVKTAFDNINKKNNKRDNNKTFESKLDHQKGSSTDDLQANEISSQNTKDYKKDYAKKEDVIKISKENNNIDTDSSFEGLKKDNRYTAPKHKQERKKYDRHKSHKKEKKRNKYEQWEMKGGLLKDYDDIASSWSDSSYSDKEINIRGDIGDTYNFDSGIEIGVSSEVLANDEDDGKSTESCDDNLSSKPEEATNWIDKRAFNRMEARKRLEKELFEDNITTAGWYFKRMRKREQCRAKRDNSTYRKFSKRFKNHKTKQ